MRALAQAKRRQYGISTNLINILVVQRVYKQEGIKIDRSNDLSPKIRAAYFCDNADCSVLLNNKLPREPKLFSLVHELKHHYVDKDVIQNGQIRCGDYNANQTIEIGAEIFAAEFIFPEGEMLALLQSLGINRQNCTERSIIEIKRTSPVSISYKFILKRLVWFGFVQSGKYDETKFAKLEEQLHGTPFYKREWYKAYRQRKSLKLVNKKPL